MMTDFFAEYGEMVISLTLMLLLLTYWFLIYRIFKLEKAMRKFDKRFESLEGLFKTVKDNIVVIVDKLRHLEMLKTAVVKFSAKTPLGPVDAEIGLSKLFEKKEEVINGESKLFEKKEEVINGEFEHA
jgi:hypothetical protein